MNFAENAHLEATIDICHARMCLSPTILLVRTMKSVIEVFEWNFIPVAVNAF